MITPYCDFHTHSTQSDGALSPKVLIAKAYDAGIRVMSITDHNSTEDLTELREYAAAFPEEFRLIQGSEISADYQDRQGNHHEIHIVALGFDPNHPEMKTLLAAHQPDRRPYIDAILEKLRMCGIDLGTYDEIRGLFPQARQLGRMALAKLLVEKGYVSSVEEAFQIYLGIEGEQKAYVENPFQYSSMDKVIRTILSAGGTPILAHLLFYGLDNNQRYGREAEQLVRSFRKILDAHGGVGGMEVFYSRYTPEERLYLLKLARKYGLLFSGGSDYHGQDIGETLEHRLSCAACADLLIHLGCRVPLSLPSVPIYVLCGFSGVGKSEVTSQLMEKGQICSKPISLIRSYTSRKPRYPDEPYVFVSRDQFLALTKSNFFLEYNSAYSKNGYGTPMNAVRSAIEQGNSTLLEIDRTGLTHLLTDGKLNPQMVRSVFLVADAAVVSDRLHFRNTETPAEIRSRLQTSIEESKHLDIYDSVIYNDNIPNTVTKVLEAFAGKNISNHFDSAKFQAEMEALLASC